MLAPPFDDGARRASCSVWTEPGVTASSAAEHELGGPDRGGAVAVVEVADVVGAPGVAAEIDPAVADETRRHVRAVPPGVHAHGSADRSRHADGPGQPAPSRVGHAAGQHGQRHGGTRPTTAERSPTAGSRRCRRRRQVDAGETRTEVHARSPSNPSSATSRLEPRPSTKTAADPPRPASTCSRHAGARRRDRRALDLDVERRRPADAVGGQRAQRLEQGGPVARGVGQRAHGVRRRASPLWATRAAGRAASSDRPRPA